MRNVQSFTRSIDHWHDVLVGSIVGLLLSYFAYHQYYPSLTSPNSHLPFPPRIYLLESGGHSRAPSVPSFTDHVPDLERGRDYDTESQLPGPVRRDTEPVPLDEIGGR